MEAKSREPSPCIQIIASATSSFSCEEKTPACPDSCAVCVIEKVQMTQSKPVVAEELTPVCKASCTSVKNDRCAVKKSPCLVKKPCQPKPLNNQKPCPLKPCGLKNSGSFKKALFLKKSFCAVKNSCQSKPCGVIKKTINSNPCGRKKPTQQLNLRGSKKPAVCPQNPYASAKNFNQVKNSTMLCEIQKSKNSCDTQQEDPCEAPKPSKPMCPEEDSCESELQSTVEELSVQSSSNDTISCSSSGSSSDSCLTLSSENESSSFSDTQSVLEADVKVIDVSTSSCNKFQFTIVTNIR